MTLLGVLNEYTCLSTSVYWSCKDSHNSASPILNVSVFYVLNLKDGKIENKCLCGIHFSALPPAICGLFKAHLG